VCASSSVQSVAQKDLETDNSRERSRSRPSCEESTCPAALCSAVIAISLPVRMGHAEQHLHAESALASSIRNSFLLIDSFYLVPFFPFPLVFFFLVFAAPLKPQLRDGRMPPRWFHSRDYDNSRAFTLRLIVTSFPTLSIRIALSAWCARRRVDRRARETRRCDARRCLLCRYRLCVKKKENYSKRDKKAKKKNIYIYICCGVRIYERSKNCSIAKSLCSTVFLTKFFLPPSLFSSFFPDAMITALK